MGTQVYGQFWNKWDRDSAYCHTHSKSCAWCKILITSLCICNETQFEFIFYGVCFQSWIFIYWWFPSQINSQSQSVSSTWNDFKKQFLVELHFQIQKRMSTNFNGCFVSLGLDWIWIGLVYFTATRLRQAIGFHPASTVACTREIFSRLPCWLWGTTLAVTWFYKSSHPACCFSHSHSWHIIKIIDQQQPATRPTWPLSSA